MIILRVKDLSLWVETSRASIDCRDGARVSQGKRRLLFLTFPSTPVRSQQFSLSVATWHRHMMDCYSRLDNFVKILNVLEIE